MLREEHAAFVQANSFYTKAMNPTLLTRHFSIENQHKLSMLMHNFTQKIPIFKATFCSKLDELSSARSTLTHTHALEKVLSMISLQTE